MSSKKKSIFDDDDDNVKETTLDVNADYATKFEKRKKFQELNECMCAVRLTVFDCFVIASFVWSKNDCVRRCCAQ